MKYKVMHRQWFESQDGMDYMDNEASGEIHSTKDDARKELHDFQDHPMWAGESFWIKEVEDDG